VKEEDTCTDERGNSVRDEDSETAKTPQEEIIR